MATYLSIDLDFWNQGKRSLTHEIGFLQTVKNTVANKIMVDSHEELLSHVNNSGCNELVNVDWHSDIVNINDPIIATWENWQKFNCGTWINFVDFQKNGKYTWIHPHKIGPNNKVGRCHRPYSKNHNPFYVNLCDWQTLEEIGSKKPEDYIKWNEITHVGIVFSYDWVRWDMPEIWDIATKVFGSKPDKSMSAKLG